MQARCSICDFAMSKGEDEFNDGICDWCVNIRNRAESRRLEVARRLSATDSYISYEESV